jgi:hypothetical protein
MAFGGLYRTLAPALSLYDGDLVVTLSRGAVRAHVNQVGVLAEHAVARAILTAVREADGFGLLPAVRDLPAVAGRSEPVPGRRFPVTNTQLPSTGTSVKPRSRAIWLSERSRRARKRSS